MATGQGISIRASAPYRLKQVFDRHTKKKARSSYRLLILDGHGSHVTMDFIEYCDKNRILLAVFPPHSTHSLQLLDVVRYEGC
jgi:hypothetical protein